MSNNKYLIVSVEDRQETWIQPVGDTSQDGGYSWREAKKADALARNIAGLLK